MPVQIITLVLQNGVAAPAEFSNAAILIFIKRRDHRQPVAALGILLLAAPGLLILRTLHVCRLPPIHTLYLFAGHGLHDKIPIQFFQPVTARLRDHLPRGQILHAHAAQRTVQPAQHIPVDLHKRSAVQIGFSLVGIVHGFHRQLRRHALQQCFDQPCAVLLALVQCLHLGLGHRGLHLGFDQLIHRISAQRR